MLDEASDRLFTASAMIETLPETLPASTILLLSFDVKYNGEKDMSITINGIRNRLSGSEAPYPNNNDTFYYMISSNEDMDALDIMFSRGEYKLTNIKAYTLPLSLLSHPGLVTFQEKGISGKEILNVLQRIHCLCGWERSCTGTS